MNEFTTKKSETATGRKLLDLMTTVMCAVILVAAFIAFRNIENTAHALIVLISGLLSDAIIFFGNRSGSNQ